MQQPESQASGTEVREFARVLSEIGSKGDLPAGAEVIQQIQTAIRKEDCNALDVVRIILKDTALSSKVLRVVNSSFYRRMGNPVSTVTGAIVLLGFQTIRDLSAGLLLIDHFTRKGSSRHIPDELRRSLYCGLLSQRLSGEVGHSSPRKPTFSDSLRISPTCGSPPTIPTTSTRPSASREKNTFRSSVRSGASSVGRRETSQPQRSTSGTFRLATSTTSVSHPPRIGRVSARRARDCRRS